MFARCYIFGVYSNEGIVRLRENSKNGWSLCFVFNHTSHGLPGDKFFFIGSNKF
uniref:Uncharacterized protein n=1 Tax=Anguilla anguilla TaxID=7936 RepID=A0A0E9VV97_ANGAN